MRTFVVVMNKLYTRNLLVGLAFILVLSSAIMNASGPGGGYSAAPSESNCTNCHGGSLVTSGTVWNGVRLTSNFTGNGYIPDSTYDMMVSFKQTGKVKFGFQVTVLDGSNLPVGTLTAVGARTSKVTAVIGGNTRQYIQHTFTGTSQVATDSTNWQFTWKAPSTNVGKVKFYVVAMAANNNGSDDPGDIIYSKSFEVSPSTLLPVANASTSNTLFCQNATIQLNGSGTNSPTSYSWKLTGGTPSTSTAQNPTVTYTTPGTKLAILTVKNSKGFSFPDTLSFNVVAAPAASITNGSSGSVCKGDSLLLIANFNTGLTYQWQHNNATTRSVYVKDTATYRVKVTNAGGCSTMSGPFKLNWYGTPTVSLTRSGTSDSVCSPAQLTFTASGNLIDSVLWYTNGSISARNKSLSNVQAISQNTSVYATVKSVNGCRSAASNTINITSFDRARLGAVSFSKTTSTINLTWTKPSQIVIVQYSLNKVNYQSTSSDTTLNLSGLTPNTKYDITLRTFQSGPCGVNDTTISVTTNACSNLAYTVDFNDRTCRGNQMTARILDLHSAKYSVSFNGGAYSLDTIYQFTPTVSDTLVISIIDSLSPTCPAIVEKRGYTIDQPVDLSTGSTAKAVSGCSSSYTMKVVPGYIFYDYYKNNVLMATTTDSSYNFTALQTGDQLTARGRSNTCSKTYGPHTFTLNTKPVSIYTFSRDWKTYTFTATNNGNAVYLWKAGAVQLGNSASFSRDMSDYNNSSVDVKLITESSAGCKDSSSQSITIPNLSSIKMIGAEQVRVYPNPFGNMLRVETLSNVYAIKVIDHLGRAIYSDEISGGTEIITSSWVAGVYHIVLTDERGESMQMTYIKN